MMKWLGILCGIVCLTLGAARARAADARVVGYFAEGRNDRADQIPADKLTHINYAFAVIKDGKCAMQDPAKALPKFAGLRALKKKHPKLRTLVSVGGWTDSAPFSDAAATRAAREKFARSCADFAHEHGFDGVDIDWEFPGGGGLDPKAYRKEDTQNFTLLLAELRSRLDAQGKADHKHYELTIAAPAGRAHYSKMELKKIVGYLDAINVMTYDYAGFWSKVTNFNSPLFAAPGDPVGPENNAAAAVKAYLDLGIPADKIVLGVPFYGRAWAGVKDVNHGLYQPHSDKRPQAKETGPEWSYWDIKKNYINHGPKRFWSDAAKVPWLFDAKTGLMVSYDDPKSIRYKAAYAKKQHLGGVMIWELSEDDAQSSLLNAIQAGLKDH
jgi:chitinase